MERVENELDFKTTGNANYGHYLKTTVSLKRTLSPSSRNAVKPNLFKKHSSTDLNKQ